MLPGQVTEETGQSPGGHDSRARGSALAGDAAEARDSESPQHVPRPGPATRMADDIVPLRGPGPATRMVDDIVPIHGPGRGDSDGG